MIEILLKIVLAGSLGGLIGLEREVSQKPAGLRTNMLLCVAAAVFTIISIHFPAFSSTADPGRIAAQIVTGIGFIGAGVIIQSKVSVVGVTTAATIWVVTAIGMAVGAGMYVVAVGATAMVLFVLVALKGLDRLLHRRQNLYLFTVVLSSRRPVRKVQKVLEEMKLSLQDHFLRREGKKYIMEFSLMMSEEERRELEARLAEIEGVEEVEGG